MLSLSRLSGQPSGPRTMPPVGDKCRDCVRLHMIGWPLLSWEEFVAQAKSNDAFKKLVLDAKGNLAGKGSPVAAEQFTQGSRTGYRMERSLVFVSSQQLEGHLKEMSQCVLKVKELKQWGLPIDTLHDEFDRPVSGILMETDEPVRVIVYADHDTSFSKCLHEPSTTIRPNQGRDLASWFRADFVEECCRRTSISVSAQVIRSEVASCKGKHGQASI